MDSDPGRSKELPEQEFIREEYSKNPYPFWICLFVLLFLVAIVGAGKLWYRHWKEQFLTRTPFAQVTNREFSLFLWQNPNYMRIHATKKAGYLTAFQYLNKITVEPELADHYVMAPPNVLFLYHVWNRLLRKEFDPRPIPEAEFIEFLEDAEEWHPRYWPTAPQPYKFLINKQLNRNSQEDLAQLPLSTLPQDVRRAFQGWKNYFKEGELINQSRPTHAEIKKFLSAHPHYARNYWRNIVQAYSIVPDDELAPFLRVAFYNYIQSIKERNKRQEP